MIPSWIESLYQLCLNDTATAAERQEFINWMSMPENRQNALILVQRTMISTEELLAPDVATTEAIVQAILLADQQNTITAAPVKKIKTNTRSWMTAAAAIIIVLAGACLFYQQYTTTANKAVTAGSDILPGKEGAVLTLADGTQVVLDSLGNGVVATQNGTRIMLQNGQLAYDAAKNNNGAVAYNTVSTPRGRQFRLVLPDGTKVWLNSASAITYPTSFDAAKRQVKMEGEVYFEVAQDRSKAFSVQARQTEVDVLGTSFNMNAYSDERIIATTLLEGSIRTAVVINDTPTQGIILEPGQQAQVTDETAAHAASRIKLLNKVDLSRVMAWKNGLFDFEDTNLASLMRQLSRWYDIEVVFEKGVPDMEFGGKMSRNMKLSDVIKALKEAGVNCSLEEGRKLIVHS